MVGLDQLIDQLPHGVDTPLGDAGLSLSLGERHRLAIARAILHDAPIILLDEPTAHLDAATEARMATGLRDWLESRTVLIAGHRRSLLTRIDRIEVIGDNRRDRDDAAALQVSP